MKRLVVSALLAAMILSAAACGVKPMNDEFYICSMAGHSRNSGSQQLFETKDAVYYLCAFREPKKPNRNKVWVSNKERTEWLPLCLKPNCLHDDDDCNAILEGNAGGRLWLYGQHFYYVSDYSSLWRMKLDGSEHEKLMDLGIEPPGYVGSFYFHDKYLILAALIPSEDDSVSLSEERHIYTVDLSMKEPELREIELVFDNEGIKTTGYPLIGEGKYLYTVLDDCTLLKLDLESGSFNKICELPFYPEESGVRISGDTLYFYEPWTAGMAVSVAIDSGEITEIKRAEPETESWFTVCGDHVVGIDPENGGTRVYTDTCELVAEAAAPEGVELVFPMWTLDDVVYGFEYVNGEESIQTPPQWYLDLAEIGTDSFGWHKWEPEE